MKHMFRIQIPSIGGDGRTGGAALGIPLSYLLPQHRAGGSVDSPVNAPTAGKPGIGCIDDRIDFLKDDVPLHQLQPARTELHQHLPFLMMI
jgi:hypothetical protein